MPQEEPGQEPTAEDRRLNSLEERLHRAEQAEAARRGDANRKPDEGYRLGNRVLAELLGGLIGGAAIGWAIDHFAGTSPWGLLVMLFLGIAVAFRNIIRITSRRPE